MSHASDVQSRLVGFLRQRRDLTRSDEARAFAEREIAENPRRSPVEALEIYREQFWYRHTGALLEDFPGVAGILGQAAWNRLVEGYLELTVLESPSLRELGAGFAAHVERQDWLEAKRLIRDMARLEWAYVEVFDAADAGPLSPEKLGAVPEDAWERVRLVPSPALRLLAVDYPVVELRRALVKAHTQSSVPLPEPAPRWLAVHRPKLNVEVHELEPLAHTLLSKLAAKTPLGRACEAAAEEAGVPAERLAEKLEGWFGSWAAAGYLVDIELD